MKRVITTSVPPWETLFLLLHTACVCLAYIIIIRIFKQNASRHLCEPAKQSGWKRMVFENASTIAFITSFLFAIHPMNVESVAWISASKILVYAFFYLLATYAFITFLEKNKTGFYMLSILLFVLSFGGKEQAVTFPVWLLMLNLFYGRSLKDRKVWIQVAPFFILSILFGIITMFSQAANGAGILSNASTYPLWQRFILGCYSLVEYFIKFTVPYNLLYLYPFPMIKGEPIPAWMLLYPAIIIIVITSFWKSIKRIPLSAGLAFYLVHIAIVLHILPISRFAVIADRYLYLAGLGLAFIFAFYLVRFLANKKGAIRRITVCCFVCLALCFCIYSNIRCRDWKDTDSIKKEIRELLKKRKDYVAPDLIKMLDDVKKEEGDLNDDDQGEDVERSETAHKIQSMTGQNTQKKKDTFCVTYKFINLLKLFLYEKIDCSGRHRSDSSGLCV